jgi:hypothetical protein
MSAKAQVLDDLLKVEFSGQDRVWNLKTSLEVPVASVSGANVTSVDEVQTRLERCSESDYLPLMRLAIFVVRTATRKSGLSRDRTRWLSSTFMAPNKPSLFLAFQTHKN